MKQTQALIQNRADNKIYWIRSFTTDIDYCKRPDTSKNLKSKNP